MNRVVLRERQDLVGLCFCCAKLVADMFCFCRMLALFSYILEHINCCFELPFLYTIPQNKQFIIYMQTNLTFAKIYVILVQLAIAV